jgi:hypothetical protein
MINNFPSIASPRGKFYALTIFTTMHYLGETGWDGWTDFGNYIYGLFKFQNPKGPEVHVLNGCIFQNPGDSQCSISCSPGLVDSSHWGCSLCGRKRYDACCYQWAASCSQQKFFLLVTASVSCYGNMRGPALQWDCPLGAVVLRILNTNLFL